MDKVTVVHPSGRELSLTPRRARVYRSLGWTDLEPDTPTRSDLKAAWVDYATTTGIDRAEAEAMTKADLIDQLSSPDET